uniref:NAD-dependent epimerase/dehydratase domain-containing protein n=1 Tax=Chaetoceros debilis TaxID=122233 RepID=A0A7S3QIP4_9STRA|mmetsp:Transcript_13933/g.20797  ORF Transcript_13933/g.20797 Transcript_13933/m.20797 type:complete len:319 (+) Transcript_13933:73-1029(+)
MVQTIKVLVTGASGYLGQHFVQALIGGNGNYEIYGLYQSLHSFTEGISHGCSSEGESISLHKLDITNKLEVDEFMSTYGPFNICFHLAALSSPRLCHEAPEKAKEINVPTHLFEKLRETPLVALSTDQVYCGKQAPYENSARTGPVNAYAQSKVEMEDCLLKDGDRKRPVVCLRSSIILGPLSPFADSHSTFLHFCESRNGQTTTFFTDEIRSVIAVGDVLKILLYFVKEKVINSFEQGVYNMGGSQRVSRMDIAEAVAIFIGFPTDNFYPAEKGSIVQDEKIGFASPLDISMKSHELETLVGFRFGDLSQIVKAAFQ